MDLINTFVLSAGVIQGTLLITVFLKKRCNNYAGILFTCFIGIVTMQVILKLLDLYFLSGHLGPAYSIFYYLPYLYGPLTYLYIKKSISKNPKFCFREMAHLLPFVISILIVIISGYDIFDIFRYIDNDIYNISDTFVQLLLLCVYIIACKKLFRNRNEEEKPGSVFDISRNWYNTLTNIVFLSGVVFIIVLTLVFYKVELYDIEFHKLNFIFLLLPAIIFWISYNALTTPDLFINKNQISGSISTGQAYVKYQNNRISDAELAGILETVNSYMAKEKAFLDPGLTMESLSVAVKIPRHSISQSINAKLNMNFSDYVNMHRVETAKIELINPQKQHLTIAAIAFESGFNSISTFNETFRKRTDLTPSQFKKKNIGKNS